VKHQLVLSTEPIDEPALIQSRKMSSRMGAAICFSGVVRGDEDGKRIRGIEYEAFGVMAEHQFHLIFDQVEQRWPIESIRLVHRLGFVPENEPSLWVEVVAPHRREAFEACQFVIEEMKRVVPIWKNPQFF
jgi:molybdopterin synthase catalytic subunit